MFGDFEEETTTSSGHILDCSVFPSLSLYWVRQWTTAACAQKPGYLVHFWLLVHHTSSQPKYDAQCQVGWIVHTGLPQKYDGKRGQLTVSN